MASFDLIQRKLQLESRLQSSASAYTHADAEMLVEAFSSREFIGLPLQEQYSFLDLVENIYSTTQHASSLSMATSVERVFQEHLLMDVIDMRRHLKTYDLLYLLYWCSASSIEQQRGFNTGVVHPFEEYLHKTQKIRERRTGARDVDQLKDRLSSQKPLRVCYLAEFVYDGMGNALSLVLESVLSGLLEHARSEYEMYVYAWRYHSSEMIDRIRSLGVTVRSFDLKHYDLLELDRLRRAFQEDGVDVAITDMNSGIPHYLFDARVAPIQIFYQLGMPFWQVSQIDAVFQGWQTPPVSIGFPSERCHVLSVPNTERSLNPTVDADQIRGERSRFPASRRMIGFYGRLIKVTDEFLSMVEGVLRKVPDTIAVLGGTGDASTIRRFIHDRDLDTRMFVVDSYVNGHLWGHFLDVFLDTYPFPGGYSCREVLAKGKPIVHRFCPEIANHCNRLDPQLRAGDFSEYRALVIRLLTDGEAYRRACDRARELSSRLWDSRPYVMQFNKALASVIGHMIQGNDNNPASKGSGLPIESGSIATTRKHALRVLLATFDLYRSVGGGQTFYRSIISKNPDIEFFYLYDLEPINTARPPNAHAVPFKRGYIQNGVPRFLDVANRDRVYGQYVAANNIAASVAGQQFDVVEIPDYQQDGTMLRSALLCHNVKFQKLALSLHGRISTTMRLNWGTPDHAIPVIKQEEDIQFRTVDIRYGLSMSYIDEWRSHHDLHVHYLHPLRFLTLPTPVLSTPQDGPPTLIFVGRTEKQKGPDIFIDLAWWLPRHLYRTAQIIGPESYDAQGQGSGAYLDRMKRNRIADIEIRPQRTPDQLNRMYAGKAMILLPSRQDTLNLIALDSLLSGCPTAIGSGAGVCRFLRETYPDVPFVEIDIHNIFDALPQISLILEEYDRYRERLVEAIRSSSPEPSGPSLHEIYRSPSSCDYSCRSEQEYQYSHIDSFCRRGLSSVHLGRRLTRMARVRWSPASKARIRRIRSLLTYSQFRVWIKQKLLKTQFGNDLSLLDQASKARQLTTSYRNLFYALPEKNREDIDRKVATCRGMAATYRIDRVRLWRELARLEKMCGHDLVAATYLLRAMRLMGRDRFSDLPYVVSVLESSEYPREAQVAAAMYCDSPDSHDRCLSLLDEAAHANQTYHEEPDYDVVVDRRMRPFYRVSVIVSLFKGEGKLPSFLSALGNQTLLRRGDAELVVVDSGSPNIVCEVFQRCATSLGIPYVYARTRQRETIQRAWNRGIALSRALYLTFLGNDEAILPSALETLAGELDADPGLDWVLGSSIVTNVDAAGSWQNDVMVYDRSVYHQDLAYLETCYLSWVGALYRRSIHDRFGYYDESFRAAGDTEFKNRVLPHIRSRSLPTTLGIFRNYPDGRTTQHPRAEIEDLRAWYLHRSPAGVTYAFRHRGADAVERLLGLALRYRKSYCHHISTDIEYAYNLSVFLKGIAPESLALQYAPGIDKLLTVYRLVDYLPLLSSMGPLWTLIKARSRASKVERTHQNILQDSTRFDYRIFNDNRHEQHANVWDVGSIMRRKSPLGSRRRKGS